CSGFSFGDRMAAMILSHQFSDPWIDYWVTIPS
ncbi:MAG: hypothetical protein ACI9MB_004375, partial [Verrucomicrobiales bacterium]